MPSKRTIANSRKRQFLVRFRRRCRLAYLRLLRINDPPERIARGAAIGIFLGIFPSFFVAPFLAFGFAFLFRANKAAAVIGSFIMNPLTQPFFWTMSVVLGSLILGADSALIFEQFKNGDVLKGLTEATAVYMVGNVIISTGVAAGSYFLIKGAVSAHRRRKAERRERERGRMLGGGA